ncbi:unnamed protein product [Jaminaea pallidilutea]
MAAVASSSSKELAGLTRGLSKSTARQAKASINSSAAEAAAAAEFASKKYVWIPDRDVGYLSAWVVKENESGSDANDEVTVALEDGNHRKVPACDLSRQNPPRFELSENIADLTFLSEAGVSHCLRQRHQKGLIYTYSGLFLVAVNPYQQLPIYTDAVVAAYKGRRREDNAPHIFAVADEAMRNMLDNRENQSLLITGESGAGKTENTKKVIQYLAAVAADMTPVSAGEGADAARPPLLRSQSSSLNILSKSGSSRYVMDRIDGVEAIGGKRLGLLERQILQANPILEAFGNAQTIRNNNSSRFGKFVRIEFTSVGAIAGANIDWYLLEKSRVHNRSDKERSFHVFYQLLRGADKDTLRELLLTGNPNDYGYLKASRQNVDGVDDTADWKELKGAFDTVGFSAAEQRNFFRIVAAILQVGNIELADDRSEQARITNGAQVEKVCHLLGIPEQELTKALLRPKVKAGREWVTQSRTRKQVIDEMAALCKTMYEKTFASIVERVNQALDRPTSKSSFIGVLDIAGFEIFEVNSFEQLCINFTNEKLQQFFNHHMFVLEQEEYARENIEWSFVNFGLDLQPTIDLIESTSPVGILACLDDECIMPKASDETFTEKCNRVWSKNKDGTPKDAAGAAAAAERGVAHGSTKYVPVRFATGFTIKHYAGNVEYSTSGWLDKNKDPLNDNLTRVMADSTDRFTAGLFAEFASDDEPAASLANSADGRPPSPVKRRQKRGAFRTLAQRHKEQLTSLMNQLASTQPHFVRCIVPNSERKPAKMELPLVLDQLRCNGVLEGIRIARLGYPNRLVFNEFRTRYEVLTPDVIPKGYVDGRKACQRMVEELRLDPEMFKIGLTKIFFKAGVLAELEEQRDALLFDIFARFQAGCRMFTARRQMRKILNRASAVRTIQRNARLYADLRDSPWWQLYTKVKPTLTATRHDEELKRKEAELALAAERAEREQKEREALEALRRNLELERNKVEEQLAIERGLLIEKDSQLARSRQREAALEEDLAAVQKDVDQLDDQLERAIQGQKTAQAAHAELQAAFDQAGDHLIRLEGMQNEWASKESTLLKEIEELRASTSQLSSEKTALSAAKDELERKVKAGSEDLERHQKRHLARISELEGSVATERQSRSSIEAARDKLEEQLQLHRSQVSEFKESAAKQALQMRERENHAASLSSQLARVVSDKDAASKLHGEVQARHDTLSAQLTASKAEALTAAKAREQLRSELDDTRRMMDAKSDEDSKQREISRRREEELTALRKKLESIEGELSTARQHASQQSSMLTTRAETAEKQHKDLMAAHRDVSGKLESHEKRLAETAASLATAEEASKSATAASKSFEKRATSAEASLTSLQSAKEALEKQVSSMRSELQDVEDALCECERSQQAWQKQAEELGGKLDSELSQRQQLENTARKHKSAADQAQHQLDNKDREISKLREDLKVTSADLRKAQSISNKTIVEHVHVLAEAKKKTDQELAAAHVDLEKSARMNAALEKFKSRLLSENEDLVRENARLNRELGGQPVNAQSVTTHGNIGNKSAGSRGGGPSEQHSELSSALHEARRERDDALSGQRRIRLQLESTTTQYEARILELERQLETSHLAHSNTYANLEDLVKDSASASNAAGRNSPSLGVGPRSDSPFKRRLLEELQNGHQALEADIAAKSQLLRSSRSDGTTAASRTEQRSQHVGNGSGDGALTPSSMKRTSTDVGTVVNSNATEELRRLQRQVKELQIELASTSQGHQEAHSRSQHWQAQAERAAEDMRKTQQYAQELEQQLRNGAKTGNGGMTSAAKGQWSPPKAGRMPIH